MPVSWFCYFQILFIFVMEKRAHSKDTEDVALKAMREGLEISVEDNSQFSAVDIYIMILSVKFRKILLIMA